MGVCSYQKSSNYMRSTRGRDSESRTLMEILPLSSTMFCVLIWKSLLDPPPSHYSQSLATLPGAELLLVFLPRVQGNSRLCQQAFQTQNQSCPISNPHLDACDYRPPASTHSRVKTKCHVPLWVLSHPPLRPAPGWTVHGSPQVPSQFQA